MKLDIQKILESKIDSDAIMRHQKATGLSWADAKRELEQKEKDAMKASKPKTSSASKEKTAMTKAEFEKTVKYARKDWLADNPGEDISQYATDIAGSLIYDPMLKNYVLNQISKNTGKSIDRIKNYEVIEYIADYLV